MATRARSNTKKAQQKNSEDRKKRSNEHSISPVVVAETEGGTPNTRKEPYINNSQLNSKGAL